MEAILELMEVLNRNNVKSLGLHRQKKQPTILGDFYEKIRTGEINSDEEAAELILNCDPSAMRYRKLKNRFKNHLIDAVYLVDVKQQGYSELDQAYINCWREWVGAKILFNRGAAKVGVEVAQKVLKQAEEFQFSEMLVNITRILRLYYSTRSPDLHRYEHFDGLYKAYVAQWQAENLAEELYVGLANAYHFYRGESLNQSNEARCAFETLRPLMAKHRSYHFLRHAYLIHIAALKAEGQHEAAVEQCREAIRELSQFTYISPLSLNTFYYQQLVGHIHLREYPQGREVAEYMLAHEASGSFNWFKNRELCLLLAFHTKNYLEAWTIFQETVQLPAFRLISGLSAEHWKLYEAYLHYLVFVGRLTVEGKPEGRSFRMSKFLNTVPNFTKDKSGMNVPVLILQVLYLMAQGSYGKAANRMESMDRYQRRHLRNNASIRLNIFLSMVLATRQAHFHVLASQRHTKVLCEKLLAHPLQISGQGHELEIIPYEDQWEMVLETLKRKT
jgi:hypothetical protein